MAAQASALPLPPRLQTAVLASLPLAQQQGLALVPTCEAGGASAAAGVAGCVPGPAEQPNDAGGSKDEPSAGQMSLDPWLLLEGGTAAGSSAPTPVAGDGLSLQLGAAAAGAAPPPWLEGAVKRRRRDLAYMPVPRTAGEEAPSIQDQLRRGPGRDAGAAAGTAGPAALLERGGSVDLTAGLFAW